MINQMENLESFSFVHNEYLPESTVECFIVFNERFDSNNIVKYVKVPAKDWRTAEVMYWKSSHPTGSGYLSQWRIK